jgi:hypothetical protein
VVGDAVGVVAAAAPLDQPVAFQTAHMVVDGRGGRQAEVGADFADGGHPAGALLDADDGAQHVQATRRHSHQNGSAAPCTASHSWSYLPTGISFDDCTPATSTTRAFNSSSDRFASFDIAYSRFRCASLITREPFSAGFAL